MLAVQRGQQSSPLIQCITWPCRLHINHGSLLHSIDPNTSVSGIVVLSIDMVDGLTDYSVIGTVGLELQLTPGTHLSWKWSSTGVSTTASPPDCTQCGASRSVSTPVLLGRALTHITDKPLDRRASIDIAVELALGPIL